MRLLAYGGTAYVERQRIGSWEDAPRDALDDSFRLEQERLTFGLCLIGKDPVLVIRQLQITKTGRGYAYTLLLDPEIDIWHKFNWDAGALGQALLDEGKDIRNQLLEQPEKLNEQELNNILADVSEKADQSVKPPKEINDREAAWIGGFFTPAASSLSPQVLDFPARPNFAQASDLIHRLPPCFRAGMGWLIGSSSQSARSFGARLSIDERADTESSTQFVELGHRLYNALHTLANDDDDELAEIANRLATKPAWDWFPDASKDAAILADRLILVASLTEFSPGQDELLDQATVTLPQTEFLQKELRRAWQGAVISAQKKLTDAQTIFALENYFDHALPLPNDYLDFLDPATVAERFVTYGLQPSDQVVPQLSLPLRRTVWGLYLQKSKNDDLPQTFFDAVDDLEEMGRDQAVAHVAELTNELGKRMATDNSLNLLFWKDHERHRHWANIRERLCDVSMQRARSGNPGWELEYLLFADDDGGEKLSKENIPQKQLREMIEKFINTVHQRREYAGEAKRWLEALGDSSLRTSGVLTCEKKHLISQIVRTHTWIKYVDLWDLYVNETAIFNPPTVTGDDRTILLMELEELIRQKPAHNFTPNVSGLQRMLGPLPESIVRFFDGLSPNFSNSAAAYNAVKAWEFDPVRASKEELRILLEVESDISNDYWLKPEFEEKQLKTLLLTLMFYSHPNRAGLYRRRFGYVLRQALDKDAKRVISNIRTIFKEGIEVPAQAQIFCERFAKDREALALMSKVLHKTTTGLDMTDALFKAAGSYFFKEAENAWIVAQENKPSPYEKLLLYHLKQRRDARIQVERRLEDRFPGERIKLRLDEILKQDSANQTDDDIPVTHTLTEHTQASDEDVAGDEEETKSFGQKFKEFFGIGSARKESKEPPRHGEIFGINSAKQRRRNNASKDGD